jgi:hypothetical protein
MAGGFLKVVHCGAIVDGWRSKSKSVTLMEKWEKQQQRGLVHEV